MKLPFNPPYNWEAMVGFFTPRMVPGLESIALNLYRRTISLDGLHGVVEIRPQEGQNYLVANIYFPEVTALTQIVQRLRRIFDLDANVAEIAAHLQRAPELTGLVAALPGLRIPGGWDSFELAVRGILEQQVSIAAATTLTSRVVKTYGEPLALKELPWNEPDLRFIFPRPEVLATADLGKLGIIRSRAFAINSLAAAVIEDSQFLSSFQNLDDAIQKLCKLPGIGEWTAHYIAMRALGEPNAFPANDLGLLRAMEKLGYPATAAQLRKISQAWRPWRAYAAMYLWSYAAAKKR